MEWEVDVDKADTRDADRGEKWRTKERRSEMGADMLSSSNVDWLSDHLYKVIEESFL